MSQVNKPIYWAEGEDGDIPEKQDADGAGMGELLERPDINAKIPTDAEQSVIRGRNGCVWMTAIEVRGMGDSVVVEGYGKKPGAINGGFRLNRSAFIELCREVIRQEDGAAPASGIGSALVAVICELEDIADTAGDDGRWNEGGSSYELLKDLHAALAKTQAKG